MILILIALVFTCISGIFLTNCRNVLCSYIIGPFTLVFSIFGFIVYLAVAWGYFASGYKADIINKEYGSNYTQEQVFYASGVIEEIRNLDRKRIQLDGNLIGCNK
jgi:hypothetical protein